MISASQDPVWGESGCGGFAADGTALGNQFKELPKKLLDAGPGAGACLSGRDIALSPAPGQCQPSAELPEPGQSHLNR